MPSCCEDTNVLWKDDFEDGAPLTANYNQISDVALTAGAGINGSTGVRNSPANGLGQFDRIVSFPTKCPDRFGFGGGGYWKFTNDPGVGGFYFLEFRIGAGGTFLSFYRDGSTLIVYGFDSGLGITPIATVANQFPSSTVFYKIDVWGRIAETGGLIGLNGGNSTRPGSGVVNVRIDDVEVVCIPKTNIIHSPLGWNRIAVGVHGDFDCLYATMGWPCGGGPAEEPFEEPCCGHAGPGGSFTGFTPTTPSLWSPQTPIVIAPGGATPSFTACTGGGAGPTLSDPTDPQTLAGIETPLVFVDVTLPDATVLRMAQQGLATPGAAYRTGRIDRISPISQTLSDHYGRITAQSVTLRLSDTDRAFRGYVASGSANRFLKNAPAVVRIESDVARRAGTAALKLASLVVREFRPVPGFGFDVELVDEGSAKASPTSLDRPIPDVNVFELFPNAAENIRNFPIPFYYGQYGDDDKDAENPKRIPVGIVPVLGPVRTETLSDGNAWRFYLICRYAVASIDSVFGSNLAVGATPGAVRLDLDVVEGKDLLVPGYSGWTSVVGSARYLDVVGQDGNTYRVTGFYAKGDRAEAHDTGGPPFSVNLCGIEATGDGTGAVIDEAAEVAFHFWNYIALQRLTTPGASWPSPPTDATGAPKVNRASVTTLNTLHLARVPTTGYQVAWAIRERRSVRSYWEEFQTGTNIRVGRDRHQIVFVDLDDGASTTGLTAFDHTSIIDGSLDVEPASEELANDLTYVYGPEASTGRFSGGMRSMADSGAISDYGETYEQPDIELHPIRVRDVADDVISRKLLRLRQEPIYGRFDTDLRGVDLSLGQLVTITHEEGLGATGWTAHVVMVTGITVHPNLGDVRVTVEFESVHQTLVEQASGWQPVGLEGSTAAVAGLESGGTAQYAASG